jgi:hypothetical protein
MIEKRNEGYEVYAAGDYNFIRDAEKDARGGKPTVNPEQAEWITDLENFSNFHDCQHFQFPATYLETYYHGKVTGWRRRLDYILASHKSLEKAGTIKCIPSSGSDHKLLIIKISLGNEKIQGRGMWKVNNTLLKDDEYCTLVENTIPNAKSSAEGQNPRATWEWTKFKIRLKQSTSIY